MKQNLVGRVKQEKKDWKEKKVDIYPTNEDGGVVEMLVDQLRPSRMIAS
jgi:hypothetical protein